MLGLTEQQVAVLEASQGVEPGVGELLLGLHRLRLLEPRPCLVPTAGLVQRVGMGRAPEHPLERVRAAVGEGDRLLGHAQRLGGLATGQLQLAQVAGTLGGSVPLTSLNVYLHRGPHGLDRLG